MLTLVATLRERGCSLVVAEGDGTLGCYDRPGVRDLMWLLDNAPQRLRGAYVADKVIGKAAASLLAVGGAKEVYGEVMSRHALPMLQAAGVAYGYGTLVDHIKQPEGSTRCPLERIVAPATTPNEAEALLRRHFDEMNKLKILRQ